MKQSARYVAIEILCRWEKTAQPIDRIMDGIFQDIPLVDSRDRHMVFAMVYGIMRWRGYLDWILAEFSHHSPDKMKVRTLQALRIGLYQLIFMNRVPASAAINETVAALKFVRQPEWLTGFVNGLLRAVARNKEKLPDPQSDDSPLPEISRLSHPDWLFERWRKRYGRKQAARICMFNNQVPDLCVRVNTRLITPARFLAELAQGKIVAKQGLFAPEAIKILDYKGLIAELPGYADGFFQVQDEAAQLITLLLSPLLPGKSYLDGCAGLGGKTSHLAQLLPDSSLAEHPTPLTAVDPSRRRIEQLAENLHRLKLTSRVAVVHGKLEKLKKANTNLFAGILIDVPCSGLGVIRRHPDIRWNRTPEDLLRYQKKQLLLLDEAASLLAPQGTLVYATCSMEPEENDEVVTQFLYRHRNFSLRRCNKYLPPPAEALVDENGFFRTIPDNNGLDGFFAARLVKSKESVPVVPQGQQ